MIDRDVGLAVAAATCCAAILAGMLVIAASGTQSWTPVLAVTGLVAVGVIVARLVMRTSTRSRKGL